MLKTGENSSKMFFMPTGLQSSVYTVVREADFIMTDGWVLALYYSGFAHYSG